MALRVTQYLRVMHSDTSMISLALSLLLKDRGVNVRDQSALEFERPNQGILKTLYYHGKNTLLHKWAILSYKVD